MGTEPVRLEAIGPNPVYVSDDQARWPYLRLCRSLQYFRKDGHPTLICY
jgi:hypothetical protein